MNSTTRNIIIVIMLAVLAFALIRVKTNMPKPEEIHSTVPPITEPITNSHTYNLTDTGISLQYPAGFTADEQYAYGAMGPGTEIKGIKFTIPATTAAGTNLSTESYISVEELPNAKTCTPAQFLSQVPSDIKTVIDNGITYSTGSTSDAGAGNRYEETVYTLPNSVPCIGIRYFIHYAVYKNFEPGTITEFNKSSLINQFDEIRRTLTIKQ